MRKMWVIAAREYKAAVRSKTFVISLLIMPIMMSASILLQWLLKDLHDTADKNYVVIDRVNRPKVVQRIEDRVKQYNDKEIFEEGRQVKPRYVLQPFTSKAQTPADIEQERFDLSEKVRAGNLIGFLEILPPDPKSAAAGTQVILRYQSNNPTQMEFSRDIEQTITAFLRQEVARQAGLKAEQAQSLLQPLRMEAKGLTKRDAEGKIEEPSAASMFAPIIVPMVLMILMFMVVLMTATPLMQGVVEEKMQRIAEVLLGSVRPFELMMGKLVGMTGVSLTMAMVYLGGAYWAANYFDFADHMSPDLIAWFVLFQILAGLMFGSLFIAVGAACTDMKETQNLLWPVMLLACLPMFFLGNILREPNSGLARGMSFFPFATPMLMITRQAIPPGLPWWEPVVGILLVLATTVFCVYAAGRIFRVGILMQGKGAKIGEMLKWVFKG